MHLIPRQRSSIAIFKKISPISLAALILQSTLTSHVILASCHTHHCFIPYSRSVYMSAASTSSTLLPHLKVFKSRSSLILASKSPRRQEILGLMGFKPDEFQVIPSNFAEDLDKTSFQNPADYAVTNAEYKAKEVAEEQFQTTIMQDSSRSIIVVGSDTIVDLDGKILEKPDDEKHAFQMIRSLAGRKHLVHSSVAIFTSKLGSKEPAIKFTETAEVSFCPLTDEEIWSYIRTSEPMDKAGSYGIQGLGGQMVRGIDGCYFTVMGLPMHRLSSSLAKMVQDGLV